MLLFSILCDILLLAAVWLGFHLLIPRSREERDAEEVFREEMGLD